MTTTNGWPGKPGVPLNSDLDGWHWLKTERGLAPWRWKENPESIMWESGWEAGDGVISPAYFAALGPCTYLGPVLTPEEIAAKDARIAELEAVLATTARVLHKAGEQFTAYANQHAAKGTADGDQKAATNQQWAQRCFNAHDAALTGGKDE